MDALTQAARVYADSHPGHDGIATTPVPGLRIKSLEAPQGDHYTVVRPLALFVLQGAKRMALGLEHCVLEAGQSTIVGADTPIVSRVEPAACQAPYLAVAIEIEMTILFEVATHIASGQPKAAKRGWCMHTDEADTAALDCVYRLLRLCEQSTAISLLRPGIMRELYYWLLSGRHGARLRTLCDPASHANRLAGAVALLRAQYRGRVTVDRLAAEAGMSLTAFHTHFKRMLSLTPGQYQKRLRLIEARRLMLEEGMSASAAAFNVGYESVPQFTREYGRLFNVTPKRDALQVRAASSRLGEIKPAQPRRRPTISLA
ncbi:MAG: AraC family transcriptional regulator [Pseudoxanthomonas sp.]